MSERSETISVRQGLLSRPCVSDCRICRCHAQSSIPEAIFRWVWRYRFLNTACNCKYWETILKNLCNGPFSGKIHQTGFVWVFYSPYRAGNAISFSGYSEKKPARCPGICARKIRRVQTQARSRPDGRSSTLSLSDGAGPLRGNSFGEDDQPGSRIFRDSNDRNFGRKQLSEERFIGKNSF